MLWMADTSVAVPLVLASHVAHEHVSRAVGDREVRLAAHSALESFSVLTRLPGDARLLPPDAAALLDDRFGSVLVPPDDVHLGLVAELALRGIAGGAVYDALIAVTARAAGATLLSRDRRALSTYERMQASVEIVDERAT